MWDPCSRHRRAFLPKHTSTEINMTPKQLVIQIRAIHIDLKDEHHNAKHALTRTFPQTREMVNDITHNLHEILERVHAKLTQLNDLLDDPDD